MRLEELRDLIRLVEESEIEELEISKWGKKVKISKKSVREAPLPAAAALPIPSLSSPSSTDTPNESQSAQEDEMDITDLVPVTSPMVGTFYAAPAPDADPFVRLGDNIRSDQVVCIVEAMKLMNEIRAESDGRIVKILVENGEPVEFGQTLFLLTPA